MSQRFIRCHHCGLPHHLTDEVCPITGKPLRQRKSAVPADGRGSEQGQPPLQLLRPWRRGSRGGEAERPTSHLHTLLGEVIGNKYRVLGLMGEGGMGTVYEAEHLEIGRRVAIKVLNRAHMGRRDAVARFHQEARAAGAIGHPNICEIYDVGRLPNGAPYLVMERLHGMTLSDRINLEGALPFLDVIGVLTQVLSALYAAHEKSIIHRDIKPENIFLTERVGCTPVAKILDFGISKSGSDMGDLSLTRTGMVMGTPFYMAPEQARGDPIDHRVDIYASGVILYETLTGRRPFIATNYNALVVQVLSTQARDPRELRPAIPGGFVPIVYRALSKRREERFPDARAFIEALSVLRDDLSRGPSPADIAKLAQEARASARPPPKLPSAPPPFPVSRTPRPVQESESIEIPVVFSDTGTDARAQSGLATGEVLVELDTGPTAQAADDGATEIGDALDFSDAAPGDVYAPAKRPEPQPIEEASDTIVDPTGAVLSELWAQLPGGTPPRGALLSNFKKAASGSRTSEPGRQGHESPPPDTDPTTRTSQLDAAEAEALLDRLDNPNGGTTGGDASSPNHPVGLYSLVQADCPPAGSESPALKPVARAKPPAQRPAARKKTSPKAEGGQPPRPASRVAPNHEAAKRPLGFPAQDGAARPRVPRPSGPPESGSASVACDGEEVDDDSVTTLFVSTSNGPQPAAAQEPAAAGPTRPDADSAATPPSGPRPPGTPRI